MALKSDGIQLCRLWCRTLTRFQAANVVVLLNSILRAGMKTCLHACSIVRMCHFRRAAGFQSRQEYSSRHLATENDEFAELGSPLVSGLRRPVKLMAEKTDRIKKNNGSHWNSSGTCSTVEASVSAEYEQLDSSLDDAVAETSAINTRTGFVTVANIPPSIELPKVVETLSSFGKISNSYMRTLRDGSACCDFEFEREEANQKALSAGVITVNNVHLPIHPGRGTVTVRIVNVCSKTSDSVVHAICRSCGFLIKATRINETTLDVSFGVENKSDAKNILNRLNYTIMDDCNWLASLLSSDAATASKSDDEDKDDASCNSGLKIGQQIAKLKRLYIMKKVHIEDLENLHEAIRHIESWNAGLREQI